MTNRSRHVAAAAVRLDAVRGAVVMRRACPMRRRAFGLLGVSACVVVAACAAPDGDAGTDESAAAADTALVVQDSTSRIAQITGLSGPEAVRYDPDQDVWFIANFGESGDEERDGNGFITRAAADGTIEELRFMVGSGVAPLHMPRGMTIHGDTLWVADMDGVHGFDRRTGEHLRFIDMTEHEPGFINDLDVDASGVVYATDTGLGRVYRVGAERATIAVEDSMTGPPNGITWDDTRAAFLLAPWDGEQRLRAWDPASGAFSEVTTLPGGNFDGIEIVGGGVLLASQADSSLHLYDGTSVRTVARVPGRPADIGVDTLRGRVAVPYIALNRVDIWEIR